MASMHSLDYDGGYEVPSNELLLPKINQSQDPWVQRKSRYFLIFKYCLCALLGFLGGVYLQYSRSSSFETSARIFQLNTTFTEAPSPVTDAAWKELVPLGRGFIAVDSSEKALLYDGRDGELLNIRAVSVFHQIHCLNELRIGFYGKQTERGTTAGTEDDASHHHSVNHMKHCFDYLRQALMCASDDTLERLQHGDDGPMASVDGWGTRHQCRSYQKVYDWTRSHRAHGHGGIQ